MDAVESSGHSGELSPATEELAKRMMTRLQGREEGDAPPDEPRDNELSAEDQVVVKQMQARDTEVRRHEEAHATVGGQYAGSPSYTYATGPDAKRYAVAGEVPIDVTPVRDDLEATIDKMEVVKAAALAPVEPSGADRRVAALADNLRAQAVADLFMERAEAQNAPPHPEQARLEAVQAYGALSDVKDRGV